MIALRHATVLPERTHTECAVASLGGRLVLAWAGTNGYLNTLSSRDGRTFGAKATLPFRCWRRKSDETDPRAPAVAGLGDDFHLAWTTDDGHPLHHVLGTADIVDLGERTNHAPALTAWGDEIVLAWRGSDRHLNLIRALGGRWASPWRLAETSRGAPALCVSGRDLVLAWTGLDRRVHVLRHRDGSEDVRARLDIESQDHPPAVCAWGDGLVVAWTARKHRITLVVLGPEGPGEPQPLDATGASGPALCTHGESLVVAWRNMRNRVCVGLAV